MMGPGFRRDAVEVILCDLCASVVKMID